MSGPQPNPSPLADFSPYFPGPRGESNSFLAQLISGLVQHNTQWRETFTAGGPSLPTPSSSPAIRAAIEAMTQDLSTRLGQTFPFHSPHYLAHQQNEVQLASLIGLIAGALSNSNNVTVESGLATAELELVACDRVMRMLGYRPPQDPAAATHPTPVGAPAETPTDPAAQTEISGWFGWSHLTSGGTAANIEALWIARVVRYMPLSVRAAANLPECAGIYLPVTLTLDDEEVDIRSADPAELLRLRPRSALTLLEQFTSALIRLDAHTSAAPPDPRHAAKRAKTLLSKPEIRAAASHPDDVAAHRPVIFVPRTAHYSLTKAADVLGLGRQSLILVDVDEQFRMSISDLRSKISEALRSGMTPIAVVAVLGSTEEGSVDPIADILTLRKEFENGEFATSFWIHVDGAWGAYLASMLAAPPPPEPAGNPTGIATFADAAHPTAQRGKPAGRRESSEAQLQRVSQSLASPHGFPTTWDTDARNLVAALRAMNRADSITVDPHKLGHVAYPCGLVAFRDDRVRDFIAERAPYITNMHGRPDGKRTPVRHKIGTDAHTGQPIIAVASIGPYTLEGSRPGSAATSLWAATEVLPLHRDAHGAMLASGLRAARYLHALLQHPPTAPTGTAGPFTFVTLTSQTPDTDIVLFTIRPGTPQQPATLQAMNSLTTAVRDALTISLERGQTDAVTDRPLFLSSTTLDESQYPYPIVTPFLARANVTDSETSYATEDIVVLRAVVANPYTWELIHQGHDPVRTAVEQLTSAAAVAQQHLGQRSS